MSIVLRGSLVIKDTPGAGGSDPILSRDSSSGAVGVEVPGIPSTLNDGNIFVGNVSNVATAVLPSGKITLTNAGVFGITTGAIVNAEISASAAIALTKLAATTANRVTITDASGFFTTSAVTNVEIAYVSGVTSAIQTQLNAKQATITGAATTITSADLTPNFALVSSALGKVAVSGISTTKLGYLSNVTSDIQAQFANKLSFSSAITPTEGDLALFDGAVWNSFPRGTSGQYLTSNATTLEWVTTPNGMPTGGIANQYLTKIDSTDFNAQWSTLTLSQVTDITASAAEVNVLATGYYDATSSIQTQLGLKLSTSLANNALFVGNASNVASQLSAGSNGQVLTVVAGSPQWQTVVGTGSVTSIDVSGGTTGLTTTGGPVTTTGTITLAGTLIPTNGGTGLTAIGAANTLLAVNNAGTGLEYKVVSNGLTSSGTSLVLGGTLTSNTTLTGNGASGDFTVTRTDTAKTNTLTLSNGGISLFSSHATQNEINIYATNGAGTNSIIDLIHTGISIDSPKVEIIGTAATVPTGGSITTRNYVLGAKTFTGKQTFVASLTTAASLNIPSGSTPTVGIADGDVWQNSNHLYARLNGVTYQLDQQGGVGTFVGLTDGPGAFTGQALKGVRVNAGETALEYVSLGGIGTVTSVSVVTANGVSGSVATATTTPAITLTLGAITPSSVNSVVLSGSSTPTLAVTGTSSITGSNTGDQTITLTGDITGSGTGSFATTLATVNSNVGSFGSGTQAGVFTVNAKGLITAASNVTVTPAVGSITGLGSGVATWLATPSYTNLTAALTGTSPYWMSASGTTFTGPNVITGSVTNTLQFKFDNTGTTLTDGAGVWVRNTQSAASGAQQYGGLISQEGQGHSTSNGSRSVIFQNYVVPIQGVANPTGFWQISAKVNGVGTGGGGLLFGVSTAGVVRTIEQIQSTAGGATFGGLGTGGTGNATVAVTSTLTTNGSAHFVSSGANSNTLVSGGISSFFSAIGNISSTSLSQQTIYSAAGNVLSCSGALVGFDYAMINTSNVVGANIAFRATTGQILFGGTTVTASTRVDQIGLGTTASTINHRWANSSNAILGTLTDDGTFTLNGNLVLATIGNGLSIKEGSNASAGVVALVAGTATVSNTRVTTSSRIKLTAQNLGTITIPAAYAVSARTANTSFTILSSDLTDTSTIYWEIMEPAP